MVLEIILLVFCGIAGIFIAKSFFIKDLKKKFVYIIPAIFATYLYTLFEILQGKEYEFNFTVFIFFSLVGLKRLITVYNSPINKNSSSD